MEKQLHWPEHHHLKHVLINALAVLPEQSSKYVNSLEIAVQYAKKLDVQKVHVMARIAEQTNENREVYIKNICLACQEFRKESITCLIEPICEAAIPGYFMNSYPKALQVLKEVNE
ncbi:hypothetical protein ACH3XW_20465 [Acanthocheilonema viteae]